MRCAVGVCNLDNQKKTKKTFIKDIKFFRFPADHNLRKAWINACKRADNNVKVDNARICSKHFEEGCFERDLQYELLGYSAKNRRLLKKDAIPTLYLSNPTIIPETNGRKDCLINRKEILVKVADNGRNTEINTNKCVVNTPVYLPESTSYNFVTKRDVSTNTDSENQEEIIFKLKQESKQLKAEIEAFKKFFTPNQIKTEKSK